jgi:hypothetical protein
VRGLAARGVAHACHRCFSSWTVSLTVHRDLKATRLRAAVDRSRTPRTLVGLKTALMTSFYYSYWPFGRSRTTRGGKGTAARRGLEEESDKTDARNVPTGGVPRVDVKGLAAKGYAATAEATRGVEATPSRPSAESTPTEPSMHHHRIGGVSTPQPIRRKTTPRDDLVQVLEGFHDMCGVSSLSSDDDVSPSGSNARSNSDSELSRSMSPGSFGSLHGPQSPFLAIPAQPGRALQQTLVHTAKAVMIKRSGDKTDSPKRRDSLLSRSIGRDGAEFGKDLARTRSWDSFGGAGYVGSENASPSQSPARVVLE